MNHKAIRILGVSLFLFAFSAGAVAQDLEMGYFLGGNPYAFRQNPAFQSERGLASIALGQTGFGAWSNLGISSLLYPDSNGKVYTFLNDRVSSAEFLKNIHQRNHIDADVLVNILTVGFWTHEDTFLTMDVNVRSLNALSAPYDLFRFLKDGSSSEGVERLVEVLTETLEVLKGLSVLLFAIVALQHHHCVDEGSLKGFHLVGRIGAGGCACLIGYAALADEVNIDFQLSVG